MMLAGAIESDLKTWRNCAGAFYLPDPLPGTDDVTISFPTNVGNAVNNRHAGVFVIDNVA